MKRVLLITLWCLSGVIWGHDEEEGKVEPLPIGNFSVPTVTQVAPVVSFGQLLIGEKALLAQLGGYYARGHHSSANVIAPNLTYGIRDDLSVSFFLPMTPQSRVGDSECSGIQDMFLQAEYGFYSKETLTYSLLASIVGNVQFPTGSCRINPPTGNGSFSYFVGATYAYLSFNWYAFVSSGVNLPTSRHGTKIGYSYLYQGGLARFIPPLSPPGWVFDVMVEVDGVYHRRDRIDGIRDFDSGGNVILVTPSLWLSSKRCTLQWGVGFPVLQNLNGEQDKLLYSIDYIFGLALQF